MEKYTNLLSKDLGLDSAGCILPMENFFSFDQIAQKEFSTEVLDLISSKVNFDFKVKFLKFREALISWLFQSTSRKKTPLLILSLSNNGAIVCQHLVDLCKNEYQERFQIKGVILDSAPGNKIQKLIVKLLYLKVIW